EEPAAPRTLDRGISVDLETIVLKALAKEPQARYASAREFADDLKRCLEDKPIRARRPSSWQHVRKWLVRHQGIVKFAAVVLVLAVLALAIGILLIWQANEEKDDALRQAEAERKIAREQQALAEQREGNVRLLLYAAEMQQANDAWGQGELGRMEDLRRRQEPRPGEKDLRSWVWYYLRRLGQPPPPSRILSGHEGDVYFAEFDPTGKVLATAGKDGFVRFWNWSTGQQERKVRVSAGDVNWVTFAPDGRTFATASAEGAVSLWERETGRKLRAFPGHRGEAVSVVFAPDGKTLASGGNDHTVRVYD